MKDETAMYFIKCILYYIVIGVLFFFVGRILPKRWFCCDRLAAWLGHSYDNMVQKAPALWGMFYQIGRFRSSLPFHTLVYKLNRYMGEPMRKYFEQHPCDVVLSLHVFPAEMLGGMKEQGIPATKTITRYMEDHPDYDLIIISGSHDALYEKLLKRYHGNPRVRLLRHTDCMAEYMRACDVLISKPGGLTSTEAAVCGVPLIHISPIPGCERSNSIHTGGLSSSG